MPKPLSVTWYDTYMVYKVHSRLKVQGAQKNILLVYMKSTVLRASEQFLTEGKNLGQIGFTFMSFYGLGTLSI